MKNIIIVLTVLFFSAALQAQKPIVVTPGVGVNDLKLGMTADEALKVLGGEISWTNYQQQVDDFISYEARIDSVMQFILGFDSCGRFEKQPPESAPVFALYFNKGRLNFITVSSYTASEEQLKLVQLSNGLKFHDAMDVCVRIMGDKYVPVGYGDYNGDYYHYEDGVEMVYDENRLTSIGIFPKTPDFIKLLVEKSKQLREEAEK